MCGNLPDIFPMLDGGISKSGQDVQEDCARQFLGDEKTAASGSD